MDQSLPTRAQHVSHIAPPQILAHERGFAITFAVTFFAFWALPVWGALVIPGAMAVLVLVYDVYWTLQALYSAGCGLYSYRRMQRTVQVNWRARFDMLDKPVQQIVVIPNYAERLETLRRTMESVARSDYPANQLNILLAMEEREDGALEKAERLREEFRDHFHHIWITLHPLLPNETAGKGANLSHAVRHVKKQCDELGWDASKVLVTSVDADTRLHTGFLAALAVEFLQSPTPTRMFFQGILLLVNNIWNVHGPVRVFSALWTFTYVTGVTHYQRMTTAVYSASLRLLEDINYWDPRVVAEDGHIFFRAFFALHGKADVCPIYLPVGLDAAQADGILEALRIQYRQMMRWAWTVSNLPYIIDQWLRHPEISLARKLRKCLPYIEGLLIIPSSWFIITMGVVLPPIFNPAVATDVFGIPLSVIAPIILAPTVLGFAILLGMNLRLRDIYSPAHPPFSLRQRIGHAAEWLLLFISAPFYFGLPYAQAYWRLLWGNDLQYERTPK